MLRAVGLRGWTVLMLGLWPAAWGGDTRTDFDADCLAPVQERAWSSPIFVDQPRSH